MTTPPVEALPVINPSVAPEKKIERKRVSMSVPSRRLEVPDLPGYRLYWFLDRNVPRALGASYEAVTSDELSVNQLNVATSKDISGNASLGSNIKVINGVSRGGDPEYFNLMKIRMEYYLEDQEALAVANARALEAIFKNEEIVDGKDSPLSAADKANRYVKTALFQRPRRKAF